MLHLALCSLGFLAAGLAGSLETPAGRRLTRERIVRKLDSAAVSRQQHGLGTIQHNK